MQISLKTPKQYSTLKSQCLVIAVHQEAKLPPNAAEIDHAMGSTISKLLKADFKAELGETLVLSLPTGCSAERLVLVGCGQSKALSDQQAIKVINAAITAAMRTPARDAHLDLGGMQVADRDDNWVITQIAKAAELKSYRYSKTLSKPKPLPNLKKLVLGYANNNQTRQAITAGQAMGIGANTARHLGDLPGNICTPSFLAKEARRIARKHSKMSCSILEEKKMRELGMGSLLSVSAGSDQPAKLIVMEYKGGSKTAKPHALVGKGITFDSGGISLKPAAKMDEMKYDMCGAASVLGTMDALTELDLPINVVAIVAASENLPSGRATKPGDVVTSMSGQTIEILNTDAEGRLVLCDALTYSQQFKPASVIDVATLTGACVVALGNHATALYSNQEDFAEELLAAGTLSADRAWHMPLWDDYQNQLDSNFADMGNVGGPEGGSITAACFLSRFTKEVRWAHLDIAGTAWISGANKGATGRPVGLLTQYLIDQAK